MIVSFHCRGFTGPPVAILIKCFRNDGSHLQIGGRNPKLTQTSRTLIVINVKLYGIRITKWHIGDLGRPSKVTLLLQSTISELL